MKGILTFILTSSVALSAMAGQQNQTKPALQTAKIAHQPVLNQFQQAQASQTDETVDLYFTSDNYTFAYYGATGDWYLGLTDDSDNYVVRLDYLTTEEGQYGTYTYNDLDTLYSYISENVDGERVDHLFLPGTQFTVASQGDYFTLTGTLLADDGKTYVLHGNCPLHQYDIEGDLFTMFEYYEEDQDWYIRFRNDDYKVTLDLLSPDGTFSGTYTEANAASQANFVTDLNEDQDEAFQTFNVTMTMPEGVTDPTVACEITGTAHTRTATYNFHMLKNAPVVAKDTVEVEASVTTAEWPSERTYGGSYYELTETNHPELQWTLAFANLTGECDEEGIYIDMTARTNSETGETLTVEHGTFQQTLDAQAMTLTVKAEVVMSDSIQYNINFTTPLQAQGEATYNFTTLELDDTYAEYGTQELIAYNDDAQLEMQLNDYAAVPGEYTDENATIGLRIYGAEPKDVSSLSIISASTTLADDGTPVLAAKFLGNDMTVYNINASFVMPAITDTLNITASGLTVTDYTEWGTYMMSGNIDDTSYIFLYVNSDQLDGHYTTEALDRGSYVTFTDEYGNQRPIKFYAADFDVTAEKRNVTLNGTFQLGNHFVNMTLTGKIEVEDAIDNDNEDEGVEVSFTAQDLVVINPDSDDNLTAHLMLKNEQRNDMLDMEFYLEQFDDETIIPEGEYEISEYGWAPSVMAGSCWFDAYLPSFYAQLDAEGYAVTPLWFLKYGTVTVTKVNGELSIEVDAYNSYYMPVTIHYNVTPDAIRDVTAKPQPTGKMMQGNQVIIVRDGKKYSLFGHAIK